MRQSTFQSSGIFRSRKIFSIAFAGAALLLVVPVAEGQSQATSPMQNQTPSATAPGQAPISDQKLGQAAAAMEQVSTVRQMYQQQIASAPETDKPRITGEAQQALAKAVTDQGLSIDEYNGIMRQAQTNPQVRDGLIQHLNLNSGGQPAAPGHTSGGQ